MKVIEKIKNEILHVLNENIESRIESQRKSMENAPPRTLHFTGSFGCYMMERSGLIHINIPTGTDKKEKLHSIVNRILQKEMNITLKDCKIEMDAVGVSNKVIEFYLPKR